MAMAFTATTSLILPLRQPIHSSISPPPTHLSPPRSGGGRRDFLFRLLSATTAVTAGRSRAANAADIPLFGLRKKIESAEKEAIELVKEGFESAEKGIDTVEKGVEAAEKGIEAAEKNIQSAEKGIATVAGSFNFTGFAQAGVVAGAEFLGVVIATAIVNGILGPDPQKS